MKSNYFLGLDIGTDSVGYAVTDTTEQYSLLKFHGEPMWGVHLFDSAETGETRRAFRTARRRLDRRQQRVLLVQELFAKEIAKKDESFFRRIKESALLRSDAAEPYCLFNDSDYSDADYHKVYPTIHHLISELMSSTDPHDVRLVYIASAWLVAHRGHFLFDLSTENVDKATDFSTVYDPLIEYFESLPVDNYCAPWECGDIGKLADSIKAKAGITAKISKIKEVLFADRKCPKGIPDPDSFPFNVELIIKLIAGGTVKLKDLFGKDEYSELEPASVSLGMDDEKFEAVLSGVNDDGELLVRLKAIYDWALLCDMLSGERYISQSKVKEYERHNEDLSLLKDMVRKYVPGKYSEVFRKYDKGIPNYVAYSGNVKSVAGDVSDFKKCGIEDLCKYLRKIFQSVTPDVRDADVFNRMIGRLEINDFLPKQVSGNNRVIPYQLYYKELEIILCNASAYLPFLSLKDDSGLTVAEKILSVMKFRVPYYVGPLNASSPRAWIVKKGEGPIYPWNFEEKVDLDASEQQFIFRMTNKCSYLAGEDVLPKNSLLYQEFSVLNEINKIKINGVLLDPEVKGAIINELFKQRKIVTPKMIKGFLVKKGYCSKEDAETMSGIDVTVKASLSSYVSFRRLMSSGVLSEDDVEEIIKTAAFSEDKNRFRKWLSAHYPAVSEEDRRYVGSLKLKDFGRLSRRFLAGIQGTDRQTGEINTVIGFLRNGNYNLMELLSDRFDFSDIIAEANRDYYEDRPRKLSDRLDEMYISNAVKRPIIRTLDVIRDVVKAAGGPPEKIFIEMARGGTEDQRGKRTKSRKQQLLELFEQVKTDDVKLLREQLEAMGEAADNRLQSEALFLYYLQLGRCMYSGQPINIEKLGDGTYNVDHIYPQSKVKDDSILNNKVLVLSTYNREKGDSFPINSEWRERMFPFWSCLKNSGLITDEKFMRLTRKTAFSEDEAWGFINRQLVETRQSTKALAVLLSELYPETRIVYVKAGIVSDFRQEYGFVKSRLVNDLHHAKDAYLNIVCGNVYNEHFTKAWFTRTYEKSEQYNIKLSKLLGEYLTREEEVFFSDGSTALRRAVVRIDSGMPAFNGKTVKNGSKIVWDGSNSFYRIFRTMRKNNIHVTKYAYCRGGGFFDQQPVKAAEGLVPRKSGLDTEEYGGYNSPKISFFIPVKYTAGKKTDIIITAVEVLYADRIQKDEAFAADYLKSRVEKTIGKTVADVSFPLGLRPLKINTLISVNGFLYSLSGSSNKGKRVILSPFVQLILNDDWEKYIKRLESVADKIRKNEKYIISEKYDGITTRTNTELYDLLIRKYSEGIYSKRINSPLNTIVAGRKTFVSLPVQKQIAVLISLIQSFGRIASGVDLSLIDGVSHAAATLYSASFSIWSKNTQKAYFVYPSSSGIWEKRSDNLLSLL